MGVVANYLELGQIAAAIVDRHERGTKLAQMPVQTAKQPRLMINATTSKAMNVNLPDALLKKAVMVEYLACVSSKKYFRRTSS